MLAYITCKNIVLFIIKPEILQKKAQIINLFLLTICVLCEKDKRIMGSSGIRFATSL